MRQLVLLAALAACAVPAVAAAGVAPDASTRFEAKGLVIETSADGKSINIEHYSACDVAPVLIKNVKLGAGGTFKYNKKAKSYARGVLDYKINGVFSSKDGGTASVRATKKQCSKKKTYKFKKTGPATGKSGVF